MLSHLLVRASDSPTLDRVVTGNRLARRISARFIAGESVADGLAAAADSAQLGRTATLDYVGEKVTEVAAAKQAAEVYRACLDGIAAQDLPSGISVKTSQLAINAEPEVCADLLREIAAAADTIGAHVTLDMEDSSTTESTVALVETLQREGHHHVGCAVQTYLHRTEADVARLSEAGASIRVCKGAYAEPPTVAFQDKAAVDAAYARVTTYLLEHGTYPRFATHDERLIAHAIAEADRFGRTRQDYEFQMLYGVREELQAELVRAGYTVCVYVPFGDNWFAYFMRRLAERPANLLFFARALVRRT